MIDCLLEDVPDQSYRDLGYIHENDIPDIEKIKHCMENVMKCLYESGNVKDMENFLHDICEELYIKVDSKKTLIEKKSQSEKISWYAGYQRALIDSTNGRSQLFIH